MSAREATALFTSTQVSRSASHRHKRQTQTIESALCRKGYTACLQQKLTTCKKRKQIWFIWSLEVQRDRLVQVLSLKNCWVFFSFCLRCLFLRFGFFFFFYSFLMAARHILPEGNVREVREKRTQPGNPKKQAFRRHQKQQNKEKQKQ